MKKIVFVYNNNGLGGAQKMIRWLATKTSHFEEKYFLAFNNKENKVLINDNNVKELTIMDAENNNSISKKIKYYFRIFKSTRKIIKQIKPDIICAFNADAVLACLYARTQNKFFLVGSERQSPQDFPFLWKKISRICYKKTDAMVFQTEAAASFYNNILQSKKIIIPNPYIGEIEKNPTPFVDRKKVFAIAAARFSYEKGFDLAIKAFSIFCQFNSEYQLEIYAEGGNREFENFCRKMVIDNKLEHRIVFKKPEKDIAKTLIDHTAFILPSRFEGIPNILLEVMGRGIPTISFDCPPGGPALLTNNGQRGILVEHGNVKKLAEEMIHLISNPVLGDSLSKQAITVGKIFSEQNIINMWDDVFLRITNEK